MCVNMSFSTRNIPKSIYKVISTIICTGLQKLQAKFFFYLLLLRTIKDQRAFTDEPTITLGFIQTVV